MTNPIHIQRGYYLTLSDYARYKNISRRTAHRHIDSGKIKIVRVGARTTLVMISRDKPQEL